MIDLPRKLIKEHGCVLKTKEILGIIDMARPKHRPKCSCDSRQRLTGTSLSSPDRSIARVLKVHEI